MMHPGPFGFFRPPYPPQPKAGQGREKEEEIAGFLVSLKNRSVTPEPHGDEPINFAHHHPHAHPHAMMKAPYQSYAPYPPFNYEAPRPVPSYRPRRLPKAPSSPEMPPREKSPLDDMTFCLDKIEWEYLLGNSTLVSIKDQDLVPDCLFVSMAQMQPCRLTIADRVGCYKDREVGFVGMCCKHCGGQPGFGRYYPNSVRSLAQTTTSQTILKHIGNKCRYVPKYVQEAVLALQEVQSEKEAMYARYSGRPRYGSRKIFFQRIWHRLHLGSADDEDSTTIKTADDESNQTPSDLDEESYCGLGNQSMSGEAEDGSKRKDPFGALPLIKKVKVTSPHHRLSADDP